jgi:transketolase
MIQNKAIQSLKVLGLDAIAKANSGHPGIVIGAAPMIHALFTKHLNVFPKISTWENRDRFILSAGHGSALLYAMLHVSGFKISLDELKSFRNFGNTPGHPEYGHTDGVETTSGPLGQGISNAVGMAIAEKHLASVFNKEQFDIINHYTYVLCGDGDLQEGVALEALSLAGHLQLSKLIILFDSNDIQLDGRVDTTYSENHALKFKAMGFDYIKVDNGMDSDTISKAISKAKKSLKPTFIEIKTIIGYQTEVAGTSDAHGKPLTKAQLEAFKTHIGFEQTPFSIPDEVYTYYKQKVYNRGKKAYKKWLELYESYQVTYPDLYKKLLSYYKTPEIKDVSELYQLSFKDTEATRISSGKVIDYLSKTFENIIGGSADLSSSTKAKGANGNFSSIHPQGRNLNFGVREHAMGAISNGILLHGGLKTFTGAFFVFSDYMKPAIRLSALMHIPNIFVMTHDSVAVGEDGPTHQPVEQIVGLRAIPNLNVIRPANYTETIVSYEYALTSSKTPTVIVLSRQDVLVSPKNIEGARRGAYIIESESNQLDGIILASGTEVGIALEARQTLLKEGLDVRVVSMPSIYTFLKQDSAYQRSVLPKGIKILAVEAASPMSWYQFTPNVIGIETFGASAEGSKVMEKYNMTSSHIVSTFKAI